MKYSLDEKFTPRDLTPEEKTFLNALAGFIIPLDLVKRNQKRAQHAAAYALGAYLYENHKEEASNLIAQYANVSCLIDDKPLK